MKESGEKVKYPKTLRELKVGKTKKDGFTLAK
jgi:hypothetical protein